MDTKTLSVQEQLKPKNKHDTRIYLLQVLIPTVFLWLLSRAVQLWSEQEQVPYFWPEKENNH